MIARTDVHYGAYQPDEIIYTPNTVCVNVNLHAVEMQWNGRIIIDWTADELHEYSWQEYAGTLKQTTNLSKRKTIMNFIQAIINFFLSLFGGKKSTASASESVSASSDAAVSTVEQQTITVCEIKTDETTFRNYMVRGESAETIDALWNEVVANETAGIYDYTITGKLAWYHLQDGQLVGNGTVAKPVVANTNNVTGTNMRQSVFDVMIAGEKDSAVIEAVKKEMAEKDAIGTYPYTISTDCWIYIINRATDQYGNDYTDQYGTQYTAVQKHK